MHTVKTPTEEKAEPPAAAVTPVSTSPATETAAAPNESVEAPVTAPEIAAAAEATANSSAPVPQVIEPIPAPENEPAITTEAPVTVIEPENVAVPGTEAKNEVEEARAGKQVRRAVVSIFGCVSGPQCRPLGTDPRCVRRPGRTRKFRSGTLPSSHAVFLVSHRGCGGLCSRSVTGESVYSQSRRPAPLAQEREEGSV